MFVSFKTKKHLWDFVRLLKVDLALTKKKLGQTKVGIKGTCFCFKNEIIN